MLSKKKKAYDTIPMEHKYFHAKLSGSLNECGNKGKGNC